MTDMCEKFVETLQKREPADFVIGGYDRAMSHRPFGACDAGSDQRRQDRRAGDEERDAIFVVQSRTIPARRGAAETT